MRVSGRSYAAWFFQFSLAMTTTSVVSVAVAERMRTSAYVVAPDSGTSSSSLLRPIADRLPPIAYGYMV